MTRTLLLAMAVLSGAIAVTIGSYSALAGSSPVGDVAGAVIGHDGADDTDVADSDDTDGGEGGGEKGEAGGGAVAPANGGDEDGGNGPPDGVPAHGRN